MRNLFALLALLGVAGIVLGVMTMVQGAAGPHGVPFEFESSGGPGTIIAGLGMLFAALYLRSAWRGRN